MEMGRTGMNLKAQRYVAGVRHTRERERERERERKKLSERESERETKMLMVHVLLFDRMGYGE